MAWKTHAVLHADLGGQKKKIRRLALPSVESYSVDSAMDTDSDSWSIEIGDPAAELIELLRRDNEVRCNIFGGESGKLEELQTGFADEVGYTEEGTLVINGRDVTCLATDSVAEPRDVRHVSPHKFVAKRGRALGMTEFKLARVKPLPEFYTDRSETEWESWYRMYRKRKMWLWSEPNGILRADLLHYSDDPTYYFGNPKNPSAKKNWIPVETCEFRSNKQGRIGTAIVIGQAKDIGTYNRVADKTIAHWVRRPIQIFQDDDVRNSSEARQTAFEEIFESKVGAIEITITVPHQGHVIRQNKMARLRLPELDIDDVFFVVGTTTIVGPQGLIHKVRLRQKGFAISRRVPDDPELVTPRSAGIIGGVFA